MADFENQRSHPFLDGLDEMNGYHTCEYGVESPEYAAALVGVADQAVSVLNAAPELATTQGGRGLEVALDACHRVAFHRDGKDRQDRPAEAGTVRLEPGDQLFLTTDTIFRIGDVNDGRDVSAATATEAELMLERLWSSARADAKAANEAAEDAVVETTMATMPPDALRYAAYVTRVGWSGIQCAPDGGLTSYRGVDYYSTPRPPDAVEDDPETALTPDMAPMYDEKLWGVLHKTLVGLSTLAVWDRSLQAYLDANQQPPVAL